MHLQEIQALDAQYYLNTYGTRQPVVFTRGQGCKLYDTEGKEYIDFLAGVAVNALGYGHPAFTEKLIAQVNAVLHTSNHFYIENQALLAKALVENSCCDRAFLCNSGTEANEGAVKLVRKYFKAQDSGRYEVLSATNSFHGRTLAMVAATGQEKYQLPYTPLPSGFRQVEFNSLSALEEAITPETAAILLETIQGEGGVIEADTAYLQGISALCKQHGILLVIDEIQTGMGRTGKLFSYEHHGIEPDIITVAKALGNGVPIGAILAKSHVADALKPGDHGTTFGGNPLACAAGLAVMHELTNTSLLAESTATGEYFLAKLKELAAKHTCINAVRGRGLMLGAELKDVEGKQIVAMCLERGIIINCAGHNTLRFIPPLTISRTEIDTLIALLDEVLP